MRLATLLILLGYLVISALGHGNPFRTPCGFRGTETRLNVDLKVLQGAVIFYAAEMGELPSSWSDLTEAEPGPFLDVVPLDPWGVEYRYLAAKDGSFAMIGTFCRDNEPGGTGDDEDRFVTVKASRARD